MGARSKHHPGGETTRRHGQRNSGGQSGGECTAAPLRSRNSRVQISSGNPFGPQSQWSSLLWEREYLQDEIVRGEKYLRQLHRDLGAGSTLLEAWTYTQTAVSAAPYTAVSTPPEIADTLERSLQDWLDRLQKRLRAVSKDIEVVPTHRALAPQRFEEPVFTLLRAAG